MTASTTPLRDVPPQPGEAAPGFDLSDSEGKLRRLSELCASSPLVVLFYRGHW